MHTKLSNQNIRADSFLVFTHVQNVQKYRKKNIQKQSDHKLITAQNCLVAET